MRLLTSEMNLKGLTTVLTQRLAVVILCLFLVVLLSACSNTRGIAVNDESNQCVYPPQPICSRGSGVCTDKEIAYFITAMGEKIKICKSLLGN